MSEDGGPTRTPAQEKSVQRQSSATPLPRLRLSLPQRAAGGFLGNLGSDSVKLILGYIVEVAKWAWKNHPAILVFLTVGSSAVLAYIASALDTIAAALQVVGSYLGEPLAAPRGDLIGVGLLIGVAIACLLILIARVRRRDAADLATLRRQHGEMKEKVDGQRNELERLSQANDRASKEIVALQGDLTQAGSELDEVRQSLGESHMANEDLEQRLRSLEGETVGQLTLLKANLEASQKAVQDLRPLAIALANLISPPKTKLGGWVALKPASFRVERIPYIGGSDKFQGGKPHCSGCGVPLMDNDRQYGARYHCFTPGCDYMDDGLTTDDVKMVRSAAESYVEGVYLAVQRSGQQVSFDPSLGFFESANKLRTISDVDRFLRGFVRQNAETSDDAGTA